MPTDVDSSSLDPVTRALYEGLPGFDEHLERFGWDQPATLWLAYLEDAAIHGDTQHVKVSWLNMDTGSAFQTDNPTAVLQRLAAHFAQHPIPTPTLAGVLFAAESWMVESSASDPERQAQLDQAAQARRLHEDPARQEIRSLTMVDTTGATYMYVAFRDRSRRPERWLQPRSDRGPVTGDIVDALATIANALAPDVVS